MDTLVAVSAKDDEVLWPLVADVGVGLVVDDQGHLVGQADLATVVGALHCQLAFALPLRCAHADAVTITAADVVVPTRLEAACWK